MVVVVVVVCRPVLQRVVPKWRPLEPEVTMVFPWPLLHQWEEAPMLHLSRCRTEETCVRLLGLGRGFGSGSRGCHCRHLRWGPNQSSFLLPTFCPVPPTPLLSPAPRILTISWWYGDVALLALKPSINWHLPSPSVCYSPGAVNVHVCGTQSQG